MITNGRKVNTTMWYIVSRIIPGFWNNLKFCYILIYLEYRQKTTPFKTCVILPSITWILRFLLLMII
jgi:hypothetical protein